MAIRSALTRLFRALPGWLYLAAGAGLICCVVVTRAWTDCQRLAWQRDVLKLENQLLAQHEASYEQFRAALDSADPTLLERLAYLHLRMVPVGSQPLDNRDQLGYAPASWRSPLPLAQQLQQQNPDLFSIELADLSGSYSNDDLYRQISLLTRNPALLPFRSALVRLAMGPRSRLLLGLGVLFLVAGLIPTSPFRRSAVSFSALAVDD